MLLSIVAYIPFLFFLIMVVVFPILPKRRGIIAIVLIGTLFLPVVGYSEGSQESKKNAEEAGVFKIGPIIFGKEVTPNIVLVFVIFLYDSKLLLSSKPSWVDLPFLWYCMAPFISTMLNDPPPDGSLTIRDAFAQTWSHSIIWAPSYVAGRLYFTKPEHFREIALGFIVSAMIYVPFCVWELRMSPNLHVKVFGFAQHEFVQTIRFGGYRPQVFFTHGLGLSLFMVTATVVAFCLVLNWKKDPARIIVRLFLWILVPLCILLKSTGALVLGLFAFAILFFIRINPSRLWLFTLVIIPILYVGLRVSGAWTGENLVEISNSSVGEDRAGSMEFRFRNENMLIDKALQKPIFGWGGWGRARVLDDEGRDITVTDGLWIITLGYLGFSGLLSLGFLLLLPATRFAIVFPPHTWMEENTIPVLALCVALVIFAIDALPNAPSISFFHMLSGALMGVNPRLFRKNKNLPRSGSRHNLKSIDLLTPAI